MIALPIPWLFIMLCTFNYPIKEEQVIVNLLIHMPAPFLVMPILAIIAVLTAFLFGFSRVEQSMVQSRRTLYYQRVWAEHTNYYCYNFAYRYYGSCCQPHLLLRKRHYIINLWK